MSSQDDPIVKGLMKELGKEDLVLTDAGWKLRDAQVGFEVASQKYAAVRDVVARHLGYAPDEKTARRYGVEFVSKGRYRFIHMATGDAIVAALREADEPMKLHEIANAMMKGGLRHVGLRTVNAALMNTAGVGKTEDGGYLYVEPKEEEEEEPFE